MSKGRQEELQSDDPLREGAEKRAALPLVTEFQGIDNGDSGIAARVTVELTEELAYLLLRERQDLFMAHGLSAKGTGQEIQVLEQVLGAIQTAKIENGQPITTQDAETLRQEFWQAWSDRMDSAYATLRDAIEERSDGFPFSRDPG